MMEDDYPSLSIGSIYTPEERAAIVEALLRLSTATGVAPECDDIRVGSEFFVGLIGVFSVTDQVKDWLFGGLTEDAKQYREAAKTLLGALPCLGADKELHVDLGLEANEIASFRTLLGKVAAACDETQQAYCWHLEREKRRTVSASKPVFRRLEKAVAECWIAHGGEIKKGEEYEAFYMLCVSPIHKRPELGRAHNIALTENSFRNHVSYWRKGIYRYLT